MRTVRAILDYLASRAIPAWRINAGFIVLPPTKEGRKARAVKGAPAGVADILAMLAPIGRMLAIEVKSRYGKVSPKQRAFLEQVARNGGSAMVARSVDDVARALANYEKHCGPIRVHDHAHPPGSEREPVRTQGRRADPVHPGQ
jgi:hypothetical protein